MTKKKDIQPAKPSAEYDSQRETRVLLEEMNQGIKIIGEQHGGIVERLDTIDNKIGTIDHRLDNIENRLGGVENRLGTVESELKIVKMAVMDNSHEIKALKNGQQEIKQKLDTVSADYGQRLHKLEAV